MSTQRVSLTDACTGENLRHELYYGDMYRIKTTVDAKKEGWRDVLHISIPFSPRKEVEFMRRFHVDRSELDDFYKNLIQAVYRHEAISRAMLESDSESLKKSAIDYTTAEVIMKDEQNPKKGVDIFLVQNMADPFTKTAEFNSSGTNLNTVLNLGIRMLAIIKQMSEHNMTMGVIDIDSLFLESNTAGEKTGFTLKDGFFFYSTMPGKKPPVLTKDTEPYVLPYLYSGEVEQDANTDVYMLCKLLWVILDGKHYADDCSVDINTDPQPKYAPDDLCDALKAGMDIGYAAYKQLNTVLRGISKQIKTGVRENVRIPFAAPSYLASTFRNFTEQYTIIGGFACGLLMTDAGLDFRQTVDIDMVLTVEAMTTEFANAFWAFIEDGGYQARQRSNGKPEFYRFVNPTNPAYPKMIELFSRLQNNG